MKILYVCKSLPKSFQGGIQTHVWHLSAHMAQLGHDVSILTAGGFRKNTTKYQLNGRTIFEIPYLPLRKQPFFKTFAEEFSFNISVNNWLKKHGSEYDLIHLQGRSGFLFPKKHNPVPVVTTLHGLVKLENNRSKINKSWDKQLHESWASHYEMNSLQNSDFLVAVSSEMMREIQEVMPNVVEKTTIIPNGVEKHCSVGKEVDKNMLLFVGRLERIKGVHTLLDAMKSVDSNIHLVMIGDGDERPEIEKRIHTEGLSNRIKLMGALPSEEVMKWVARSYSLILPSFHETQGIVLLEANSCGRPVLASNIAGIKEVVQHGRNGLLFDPYNVSQISDNINRLFREPQSATRMGLEGEKIVAEKFLWESIARRTESLYLKLTKKEAPLMRLQVKDKTPSSNSILILNDAEK